MKINMDKHIWEGWTVGDFISDLDNEIRRIMDGDHFYKKPFQTKEEIKNYCVSNQPYYKKYIPEVVSYFCDLYKIKEN